MELLEFIKNFTTNANFSHSVVTVNNQTGQFSVYRKNAHGNQTGFEKFINELKDLIDAIVRKIFNHEDGDIGLVAQHYTHALSDRNIYILYAESNAENHVNYIRPITDVTRQFLEHAHNSHHAQAEQLLQNLDNRLSAFETKRMILEGFLREFPEHRFSQFYNQANLTKEGKVVLIEKFIELSNKISYFELKDQFVHVLHYAIENVNEGSIHEMDLNSLIGSYDYYVFAKEVSSIIGSNDFSEQLTQNEISLAQLNNIVSLGQMLQSFESNTGISIERNAQAIAGIIKEKYGSEITFNEPLNISANDLNALYYQHKAQQLATLFPGSNLAKYIDSHHENPNPIFCENIQKLCDRLDAYEKLEFTHDPSGINYETNHLLAKFIDYGINPATEKLFFDGNEDPVLLPQNHNQIVFDFLKGYADVYEKGMQLLDNTRALDNRSETIFNTFDFYREFFKEYTLPSESITRKEFDAKFQPLIEIDHKIKEEVTTATTLARIAGRLEVLRSTINIENQEDIKNAFKKFTTFNRSRGWPLIERFYLEKNMKQLTPKESLNRLEEMVKGFMFQAANNNRIINAAIEAFFTRNDVQNKLREIVRNS